VCFVFGGGKEVVDLLYVLYGVVALNGLVVVLAIAHEHKNQRPNE